MSRTSPAIDCILDAKASIGESPVWSAEEQALHWVDILAPVLFRLDPATGDRRRRNLPEAVGSFGLCQDGAVILALRSGRPDGGATDAEGHCWSAGISAGVLNRWSPDGRLDRQIAMPCAAPTCPCFGGPVARFGG